MSNSFYVKYSEEQLAKVGNAIIYMINAIGKPSKTKLLKLLYILDEKSIDKYGMPFFNLQYKVWKFGPVAEDIYVELSSKVNLLKKYVEREQNDINSIAEFNDDEFSDNDIELMDNIIKDFGNKTANELTAYTHRKDSLWYNMAKKNNVLELLEKEEINSTELVIDFKELLKHDTRKLSIYKDCLER